MSDTKEFRIPHHIAKGDIEDRLIWAQSVMAFIADVAIPLNKPSDMDFPFLSPEGRWGLHFLAQDVGDVLKECGELVEPVKKEEGGQ